MGSDNPDLAEARLLISNWGIPEVICARYEDLGVRRLYTWQAECLETDNGRILMGGNLVYSAPTSGGKTFVAEILMLRVLVSLGKKALFVLPYVSVVMEKVRVLQSEHYRQDTHFSVRLPIFNRYLNPWIWWYKGFMEVRRMEALLWTYQKLTSLSALSRKPIAL